MPPLDNPNPLNAIIRTSSPRSRPTFVLTLDPSRFIPIVLKDIYTSPSTFWPDLAVILSKRGDKVPGKLYREEHASALLDTLQTGGSCARIAIDGDRHGAEYGNKAGLFAQFKDRMGGGGLVSRATYKLRSFALTCDTQFIALNGPDLLAFCASENATMAQRLNIHSRLIGIAGEVLMSHIRIRDFSAYATAALLAEDVQWR